MRKKIKTKLAGRRGVRAVQRYRRGAPLTLEQGSNLRFRSDLLASMDGKMVAVFGDEDERRLAWREHGHRFAGTTNRWTRPSAFWEFTDDVPDELRGFPSVTSYPSLDEAVMAHHAIAAARRQWLRAHPEHWTEREREQADPRENPR